MSIKFSAGLTTSRGACINHSDGWKKSQVFKYLALFQFREKNKQTKKPTQSILVIGRKLLPLFENDPDYIFGKNIITKILFNDFFDHF